MATKTLHVVPVSADDWMVREASGRELGHYPSQEEALRVARKLARSRGAQLLIQDQAGTTRTGRASKGFFARLFGR
jgi:hypothetical protein